MLQMKTEMWDWMRGDKRKRGKSNVPETEKGLTK